MSKFILSCGSTVDVPYAAFSKRDIRVIFYSYFIDGAEHEDDMCRTEGATRAYYDELASGKTPTTSQINEETYFDYFDALCAEGDVLHIAFGSGMSGSVFNAIAAAKRAEQAHPNRKVAVVDSLCSSSGYGMLVDDAADLRDEGKSLEEVAAFVQENRGNYQHLFFSTDLTFFRRSGRVNAPAAFFGSILGICPLMRLNADGKIVPYDKALGKRKAMQKTVKSVLAAMPDGYDGKIWLCHSDCPDLADDTRALLRQALPAYDEDMPIFDIGPVISSHCGPGTVAVFFAGSPRKP